MARSNDPIKTGVRKAKAQRRTGDGALCSDCGDNRPEMLVRNSRPKRCHKCYAIAKGRRDTEDHHLGGKANSPLTVRTPIKEHRTLSEAQYEWPPGTLENPDRSPLIGIAGSLRGVADFIGELITVLIHRLAQAAEDIDAWLRERYGKNWWEGGPFDGWQPE